MVQVNELQFIYMNLCVCYTCAMTGRWIYRTTKRFYEDYKYRKERKIQAHKANLEYHKIIPSLNLLDDLMKKAESWRVTTICVPNTELQQAAWSERNIMVDRFKAEIQYRIDKEMANCERRAELSGAESK